MKAIVNGIILLPDREVRDCALLYDEKIIGITREAQADEVIDAGGAYVSPGLIDTHIHGYTGHEATDATREALCSIAHGLLQDGVTAFLPTAGANAWPVLQKTFEQTRALMGESSSAAFPGAEILGCHSEGPFINPSKKGAMNEKYIQPLDAGKILPYADVIRVLTFAPELPGGAEFIRTLKEKTDIALSMGHTNATFEQAMEAVGLGVTRVTHLFNAMSPLHHREPGVAGAALTADVYTELIADTFHVDKGLFPLIIRAKGDHLILITDTGRHIGLPDGEYEEPRWASEVETNMCSYCDLLSSDNRKQVLALIRSMLPDVFEDPELDAETPLKKIMKANSVRSYCSVETARQISELGVDKQYRRRNIVYSYNALELNILPYIAVNFDVSLHWLLGLDESVTVLAGSGETESIMKLFCFLPDDRKNIVYNAVAFAVNEGGAL